MEPMALGSPPSSPGTSPSLNPNFLPAFLMGEAQTSSPRPSTISPSKSRSVAPGFKSPSLEMRPVRFTMQSPTHDPQTSFSMSEKTGPPTRGLFDSMHSYYSPQNKENRPCGAPKEVVTSTPQKLENYPRNLNESLSRSQKRSYAPSEGLWVTVLGFPPHAASLVLSQFAQCGTITEKKFPAEGNWVNLKYGSEFEVAKALSFNGKLISNSIMVGVIPCSGAERENVGSLGGGIQQGIVAAASPTSPNRARPLTQSFGVNQNSEVLGPPNVPQRATGFVSKAMEYVFGW